MNADPTSSGLGSKRAKYGEADWNSVRSAFASSIMVDTSLNSLAQNLDMPDWPLGQGETPSKYIDMTYAELTTLPDLRGRPERIDHLITILKETLAFDEPFGEMVVSAGDVDKDNPILRNLAKLGVPEAFPMSLVALTAETRDFCTRESLLTLREFALFAQRMAQTVIVGGDFRALVNALSHVDEKTLALYLPFRPGTRGVHLIEGIALAVRAYPAPTQAGLARAFGARLGADDAAKASIASQLEVEGAAKVLGDHTAAYVEYFEKDLAVLQEQVNEGVALGRLATVLNDPIAESIVTNLLKPYLHFPNAKAPVMATTPPLEGPPPRRGFFASLFRLFKK